MKVRKVTLIFGSEKPAPQIKKRKPSSRAGIAALKSIKSVVQVDIKSDVQDDLCHLDPDLEALFDPWVRIMAEADELSAFGSASRDELDRICIPGKKAWVRK